MAIVPVRSLGQVGIVKDVAPYDLPLNAWSDGRNIRFVNNRARRGNVLRTVNNTTAFEFIPVHVFGIRPASGFDTVILLEDDMTVWSFVNDTLEDISPTSGFSPSVAASAVTTCKLAGIDYVNRDSHVPFYKSDANNSFENLPNWDTEWRTRVLRSFKDFLIALNVTKGALSFPTMMKWSDTTLAGLVPGSWDHTDPSKNAGENSLPEIKGELIDGGGLKNAFMLYSKTETWVAEYVGGTKIFAWRRLFGDNRGIINTNCWVEVNGRHYVFGNNDIWVHDGISETSIIAGRNKEFLYGSLNELKANKCVVGHNPYTTELYFCYPSDLSEVQFPGTDYANFAAVYNYVSDNWSFQDFPNISSIGYSNVDTVLTYDLAGTQGLIYDTVGGTYAEQNDSFSTHMLCTSVADEDNGIEETRLLAIDLPDAGRVAKPVELSLLGPAFLQRTGIDTDELGGDLEGKKLVRAVFPQTDLLDPDSSITITLGYHDTPGAAVTWGTPHAFNPDTTYKINSRNNGRYLALRVEFANPHDAEISGYDADVVPISRR